MIGSSELVLKGFCENCPFFDPIYNRVEFISFSEEFQRAVTIHCSHKEACDRTYLLGRNEALKEVIKKCECDSKSQ